MRSTFALVAALTISTVAPHAADADPVRIDSGFVFINDDPAQSFGVDFGLLGEGFAFIGEDTDTFNYLAGFSSSVTPFLLRFSGVPDPTSNSSCPGCTYSGEFLFRFGPVSSGLSAFLMSGVLMGTAPGATPMSTELFGRGRMLAGERNVLFEFQSEPAPVPEPSTLVLAAAGAAALWRRRHSTRLRA